MNIEDLQEGVQNPFEDVPDKYNKFLYRLITGHGAVLFSLHQQVEKLQKQIETHERSHTVASRELMKMSERADKEKVN